MFLKLRLIVLFVLALSISCFTLNFTGINSSVNAQEVKPPQTTETTETANPQSKECPLSKSGNPSCKSASGCGSQGCCKQSKACYHGSSCAGKQGGCNTPCNKSGGYGYGGGHSAADMIGLVHRAKKELLKEKIKTIIEAKMGTKLDKVAGLLVDAMFEEYKTGRANKERRSELEKKLIEIFSEKDSK